LLPGARVNALSWYEEGGDCLWLYGGEGVDSSGADLGQLSDLWKFDLATYSWEWIGGSQGLYDKIGKSKSSMATPGYRSSSITWNDSSGNFWLLGGQSKMTSTEVDVDQMLWKYEVKLKKWSMILTPASPNIISDGSGFLSSEGDLMLFGGRKINFGNLKAYPTNEVWKIKRK
jgi:hypothetical protein